MAVVDRCVCHEVPLTQVKLHIAAMGESGKVPEDMLLARVASELRCTTGCGMCEPYIRLMIRTGRTAFDHREPIIKAVLSERS
jgi:NAD(P)H-nitrite reductase large subunit